LELPLFDFKTIANATDDTIKVGLLTSLPNADNGLVLFKADIYNPTEFEAAIEGCHFVFHVATPMLHTHNSQCNCSMAGSNFWCYVSKKV
ncbi:hypothetical protein Q8G47_28375, partial [Klebsiella pneumoniae]|uniref:hypothetical protein n=1 Tax=Klebsiella pneumoniae TaxID=573 RepID=UPI003013AB22